MLPKLSATVLHLWVVHYLHHAKNCHFPSTHPPSSRSVTFAHKTLCVASHLEQIPRMHNSLDAKRTFEIVKRLGNAMEWVPDLLVVNPKTCDIVS